MFFNDDAWMEGASIGEIADKLLSKYPKLKKEGKGKDEEYAAWFLKLLEKVKEGKYPYAFEDYGYDIFEEGKIRFLNSVTQLSTPRLETAITAATINQTKN